jgi:hypothetical protein
VGVDSQEGNDVSESGYSSHIRAFNNEPSEDYDQLQTRLGIIEPTRIGSKIMSRLNSLWAMWPILLQGRQSLHDFLHLRLEGCSPDLHDILLVGRVIQDIIRQSLG